MGHGSHDHGAHAAHGADSAPTGPVEIPPVPAERSITPAPEDFRHLPGPGALLWPVVWVGVAALLLSVLLKAGWPAYHDEHGGHAAPSEHGAPSGH